MSMKKKNLSAVIIFSMTLTSCWYNRKWEKLHPYGQLSGPAAPCDTTGAISYSVTVQPIIVSKCATSGCHVSHAQVNYNLFANVVTDAQAASPNDIMTRLNLPSGNPSHMPQSSTMTNCEIAQIRVWIQQGCQNN